MRSPTPDHEGFKAILPSSALLQARLILLDTTNLFTASRTEELDGDLLQASLKCLEEINRLDDEDEHLSAIKRLSPASLWRHRRCLNTAIALRARARSFQRATSMLQRLESESPPTPSPARIEPRSDSEYPENYWPATTSTVTRESIIHVTLGPLPPDVDPAHLLRVVRELAVRDGHHNRQITMGQVDAQGMVTVQFRDISETLAFETQWNAEQPPEYPAVPAALEAVQAPDYSELEAPEYSEVAAV
ncbi:hypothetical protein C8R46DRAFT_1068234 [Mycena filopes]|nr:hypothetical protein C8R46DRAFT_1068234 [Mycena filopes]